MTEKPKKLCRNPIIPQVGKETSKKATNREVLDIIVINQRTQGNQLGDLNCRVGKLEQKVDDYIINREKQEIREDKQDDKTQSNAKWVAAFIVSTVLGVAGFLWGVFH